VPYGQKPCGFGATGTPQLGQSPSAFGVAGADVDFLLAALVPAANAAVDARAITHARTTLFTIEPSFVGCSMATKPRGPQEGAE
jgi:hypothetical protein